MFSEQNFFVDENSFIDVRDLQRAILLDKVYTAMQRLHKFLQDNTKSR